MATLTSLNSSAAADVLIIQPSRGWLKLNLGELWDYRELLYFLVWRDIKVRYRQTALGAAWAVLQPVGTMVVFSIFFGKLAGLSSEGASYWQFSLAGLVPWTFFSTALLLGSDSLVSNRALVSKIYFPPPLTPAVVIAT